jgi:ABC-type enterobactin transport system permease subunit
MDAIKSLFGNILGSPKTSAAGAGAIIGGILAKIIFDQFGITIPAEVIAGGVAVVQFFILLFVKGAPKA